MTESIIPGSAADIARIQAEDAERRRLKDEKKKKKGWRPFGEKDVPLYTVKVDAGQPSSESGFPKGQVSGGQVPKVPR